MIRKLYNADVAVNEALGGRRGETVSRSAGRGIAAVAPVSIATGVVIFHAALAVGLVVGGVVLYERLRDE